MIEVVDLHKSFSDQKVLRGVDFHLGFKDQCVIRGSSGSGKSTLLHLLAGLDKPDRGAIEVNGSNLSKLNDSDLASYRNNTIGLVFQFHFLLPSMSVLDNIYLPARIGGRFSKEIELRTHELADYLGVSQCLKKYPFQISGGEQQRINIIRAVSMAPKLLLCDEPTGNLDSENTEKVIYLIKNIAAQLDITLVIITHDQEVARSFPLVYTMQDGLLRNA